LKDRFLNSFDHLGLSEPILRALTEERYAHPTPIQAQTIPHVMSGRDVVGIAQTGTGKTAAFALPILNHLAANPKQIVRKACRVLVLSPTRELSAQIVDSFKTYGRHLKATAALAIGGVPIGRQQRATAAGVDILVATPGRLLDLMHMGSVRLDQVEIFVLDEADRMLDMGFINDIRKIVGKLPAKRQTLFFSATMPREIEELAGRMLRDPARVAVTPVASTAERIAQRVMHVDKNRKSSLLADVLRSEPIDRALVFTRTKHGADRVVRHLLKAGLPAEAIHGTKSQGQRERALSSFRQGGIRILIATDIAARGIDVDGISHVVNFDIPNVPETYVHRIGRTARAGAEGVAISFCDPEERAYLRAIEKLTRMAIPAENSGSPRTDATARAPDSKPREHRFRNGNSRPDGAKPHAAKAKNRRRRHPRQERPAQAPHSQGEIAQVGFMRSRHARNTDAQDRSR
jgi:ATP-dependent RNA helicase RhlE